MEVESWASGQRLLSLGMKQRKFCGAGGHESSRHLVDRESAIPNDACLPKKSGEIKTSLSTAPAANARSSIIKSTHYTTVLPFTFYRCPRRESNSCIMAAIHLTASQTADSRIRVEDYLDDKIQTAADLENVDDLLSRVQQQQELLRKQVT
jgi:hypothetical protein